MTRRSVKISSQAARDIRDITRASRRLFGDSAAIRYRSLILAAIERLCEEPAQRTSKVHKDVSGAASLFHLRHLRQSGTQTVRNPRHLVVYTFDAETLRIQRILYDAMDLPKHLPPKA